MGNGTGDIEDLLERAYESEDAGEVEELVERALELDPENPEVLLLQADLTEDDDVRLPILVHAIKNARRKIPKMSKKDHLAIKVKIHRVFLLLSSSSSSPLPFSGDTN